MMIISIYLAVIFIAITFSMTIYEAIRSDIESKRIDKELEELYGEDETV